MTPTLAEPQVVEKPVSSFFSSAEREELLQQLQHYTLYSDLLLSLSGPACSGKSQLLQAFIAGLPSEFDCCQIKAQKNLGASGLLGQLVRYLGGDGEPRTLWLARQFADLASRSRSLLFAIDQAELLDQEALNWLIHFQSQVQANNWPLHILLVSRQSLAEQVDSESALADTVLPLQMAPLTSPLARQFVGQLEQTLGRKFPPCNDVQLEQLCKKSADSFEQLLELLKQHTRSKKVALPWLALSLWQYLLLGSALLLLSALVVLHGLYGEPDAESDPEMAVLEEIPIPILAQPEPLPPALPDTVTAAESEPAVAKEPAAPKEQAAQVKSEPLPAVPEPKEPPVEAAPAVKPVPGPAFEPKPAPVVEPKPAPAAEKTPDIVEKPKAVEPTQVVSAPAPVAEKPKPAAQPVQKPVQAEAKPLQFGWEWLSRQPQDGFVLQLLGSGSEAGVKGYVEKYPGNRLLWYKTSRNNKPWFVVIQGYYPSRAAAEQGAAQLPKAISPQKPWIRPVAQVLGERR